MKRLPLRFPTWLAALALMGAAAAAGIAVNLVLLGVNISAADPVGHFKPQLGLAVATPEAKAMPARGRTATKQERRNAKRRHERTASATPTAALRRGTSTAPASPEDDWSSTTHDRTEPGETDDD